MWVSVIFSENDANRFLGNHENLLTEEKGGSGGGDVGGGVEGVSKGGENRANGMSMKQTSKRFQICGQLICYSKENGN